MTEESEIGDQGSEAKSAEAESPAMRMEFAPRGRFCEFFLDGERQKGVQSVTIRAGVKETTTVIVDRRERTDEGLWVERRTTYVIEKGGMIADLHKMVPEEEDYSEGGYKEFWMEFAGLRPGEKSPTEVMVAGRVTTHPITHVPLVSLQGDCGGVDLCRGDATVGWADLFRIPLGSMVAVSGEVMRPQEKEGLLGVDGRLRVMVREWAVRPGREMPPLFFRKGRFGAAMVRRFLLESPYEVVDDPPIGFPKSMPGEMAEDEPPGTGFDAFHREFADVQPGQTTEIEVMVAGRPSESWRTRWPAPVPLLPGWSDPEGLAITLRDLDSRGADLFCGDWTKSFPALLELRKDALLAASGTVFRTTGGRLGVKVRYWAAANPDRSSPPSRSYRRSHAVSEEMVRAFLKGEL